MATIETPITRSREETGSATQSVVNRVGTPSPWRSKAFAVGGCLLLILAVLCAFLKLCDDLRF